MKRLLFILSAAALFCLTTVTSALANSSVTEGVGGTDVSGAGGSAGGTAFTGANISLGALMVAALLIVGIGSLLLGRRRAAATQ